jgi:hypothetical protein
MENDAGMLSNPPIALVEGEKFEETPFDMNVSQWLCEEKLSKRMVHTRINHLTWNHQLSPNPHVLAIYLKFVLVHGAVLKRFEECQCGDDDVCFHC